MCNLRIPSKKGGLGRNSPVWGTRQDVSPPRCSELMQWRQLALLYRTKPHQHSAGLHLQTLPEMPSVLQHVGEPTRHAGISHPRWCLHAVL